MQNNELMHYDVLGMKWGRRKARPATGYSKERAARQQFKRDVRVARRSGLKMTNSRGQSTRSKNIRSDAQKFYNSDGQRIGKEKASKILQEARRKNMRADRIDKAVTAAGAALTVSSLAAIGYLTRR